MEENKNVEISIIMGSDSDLNIMVECFKILDEFEISYDINILSAHRTPRELEQFIADVENEVDVIIAAAGKAAHLPGVIAANTLIPVVGLPIKSSTMDGLDSLLSMVQMPSGIPVATVTIDSGLNAVLMAMQIMSVKYPKLKEDLRNYRQEMAQKVLKDDECLRG